MTAEHESARDAEDNEYKRCSFCGQIVDDTGRLIRGPGRVRICDVCVGFCNAQLAARRAHAEGRRYWKRKRPSGARRRTKALVPVGSDDAVKRVREAYDDIVRLSKLPLSVINHRRPPDERYSSPTQYARELEGRASGISNFAIETRLITVDQWLQVLRDFVDEHPDALTRA
ncbi:MAG: ClpX C4-type zinc finger protein [Chloroflexota bacterium]